MEKEEKKIEKRYQLLCDPSHKTASKHISRAIAEYVHQHSTAAFAGDKFSITVGLQDTYPVFSFQGEKFCRLTPNQQDPETRQELQLASSAHYPKAG